MMKTQNEDSDSLVTSLIKLQKAQFEGRLREQWIDKYPNWAWWFEGQQADACKGHSGGLDNLELNIMILELMERVGKLEWAHLQSTSKNGSGSRQEL